MVFESAYELFDLVKEGEGGQEVVCVMQSWMQSVWGWIFSRYMKCVSIRGIKEDLRKGNRF